MASRSPSSPESVLRDYFHAKDENRPHLLAGVFSLDARLTVRNKAGNIAFPAATQGRAAIADVLVRRFNQTYENIYSFYMARPPAVAEAFSCDWLVGMSEKDSNSVRIGCGRYDWSFESGGRCVATTLVIAIEAMLVLEPQTAGVLLPWLLGLSYPWSCPEEVVMSAPRLDALAPVLDYLNRDENRA